MAEDLRIVDEMNFQQIGDRIVELDGSQKEFSTRIRDLKEELQKWRLNLYSQVNTYKDELSELKKELNSDTDKLKLEVEEVKNNIHIREKNWAFSLFNFGIKDESENTLQTANSDGMKERLENVQKFIEEKTKENEDENSP